MSKSLQEQLLGANLIDGKKAKKISKENRKAKNIQRRNKEDTLSEAQIAAKEAKKAKQIKDSELNQQKNKVAEEKSVIAQIAQLIKHYRIEKTEGDNEYNFTDGKVIKKIRTTPAISNEIIRGRLCIAKINSNATNNHQDTNYDIIPRPIAKKIMERDASAIVVFNKTLSQQSTEKNTAEKTGTDTIESDEEYYAQFEIPDDLDW